MAIDNMNPKGENTMTWMGDLWWPMVTCGDLWLPGWLEMRMEMRQLWDNIWSICMHVCMHIYIYIYLWDNACVIRCIQNVTTDFQKRLAESFLLHPSSPVGSSLVPPIETPKRPKWAICWLESLVLRWCRRVSLSWLPGTTGPTWEACIIRRGKKRKQWISNLHSYL